MTTARIYAVLAVLLVLIGTGAACVYGGMRIERAKWVEQQKADLVASREYAAEDQRRATRTLEALAGDIAAANDIIEQLKAEISRVRHPLVTVVGANGASVACTVRSAPGESHAGAAGGGADHPGVGVGSEQDAAPEPERSTAVAGPDGAGSVRLTEHAVRLWDSATAGDYVPAGACRADDPSAPECSAPSEYTLEDAWRNHADNARACAVVRAKYKRLVEFLKAREEGKQ